MTTYKPTKGERAVLYGTATGSVTVMVADSLPKFDVVGSYEPDGSLLYNPFLRHGTQVVGLDQDTRDWVWQTLLEAKHRHTTGRSCEDMATHHIDTSGHLPHIAPIDQEEES